MSSAYAPVPTRDRERPARAQQDRQAAPSPHARALAQEDAPEKESFLSPTLHPASPKEILVHAAAAAAAAAAPNAPPPASCLLPSPQAAAASLAPSAAASPLRPARDPIAFIPISTDGVFFNLSAKPDPAAACALGPHPTAAPGPPRPGAGAGEEELPSYEAVADLSPPNYSETMYILNDDPSDLLIEDVPVGSFHWYILSFGISYFFSLPGFVLVSLLSQTHAGKLGALGGLGLTLLTMAMSFFNPASNASSADGTAASSPPSPAMLPRHGHYHPGPGAPPGPHQPILAMLFVLVGLCMLFYSLFSFTRMRIMAQNRLRGALESTNATATTTAAATSTGLSSGTHTAP